MVDRIVEQKETTAKTNFQLYVGGLYIPDSRLRQDGEFPNFKDDYTAGGPVAGFQLPFLRRPDSRWFRRGDLVGEFSVTWLDGDHGSRNSRRTQMELRPGWKQLIYTRDFDYRSLSFYVLPETGPGWGPNWLNFGRGYEPKREDRWTWQVLGLGGTEFCFDERICMWGEAGYFYESSLTGSPPYTNHGPVFRGGIALRSVDVITRKIIITRADDPPPQGELPGKEPPKPPEPAPAETADPLQEILAEANTSLSELAKTDFVFPPKTDEVPLEEIPNYGGSGETVEKNIRLEFIVGRYLAENPGLKVRLHGHYLARESAKTRQARIEKQALAGEKIEPEDEAENRKRSVVLAIRVKKYLVEEVGIDPERILIDAEKICRNEEGEVVPCTGDHEGHHIVDIRGPSVHGSEEPIYPEGKPDPSDWGNRRVHFEYFEDEGDSFVEAILDETS